MGRGRPTLDGRRIVFASDRASVRASMYRHVQL